MRKQSEQFQVTLPGGAVITGSKEQVAAAMGIDLPANEPKSRKGKGKGKGKGKKVGPTVLSSKRLRALKATGTVPYGLDKHEAAEYLAANGVTGFVAPSGNVRNKIHRRNCSDTACTHPAHSEDV